MRECGHHSILTEVPTDGEDGEDTGGSLPGLRPICVDNFMTEGRYWPIAKKFAGEKRVRSEGNNASNRFCCTIWIVNDHVRWRESTPFLYSNNLYAHTHTATYRLMPESE